MTDYIKRADAIDACCRGWNNTAEDCIRNIKALPSAEYARIEVYRDLYEKYIDLKHKTAWIPCSERLPSEDGLYLIQTNYMYHGIPNMDVYYWADGWNCIRLLNGMVKREYEIDGVLAWMPLPKPYREDGET